MDARCEMRPHPISSGGGGGRRGGSCRGWRCVVVARDASLILVCEERELVADCDVGERRAILHTYTNACASYVGERGVLRTSTSTCTRTRT